MMMFPKGRGGAGGSGPPGVDHAAGGTLRGERVPDGGRSGRARNRSRRRGSNKPALHRSLPRPGPRAPRRAQARTRAYPPEMVRAEYERLILAG